MYQLKISSIAAIIMVVAFTPFALPVYFLAQQKIIQFHIHEALEEEGLLQTITVHQSDVNWVTQNEEILLNGKLFDIKHFTRSGNYLTVTGIFDGKEDELNYRLKKTEQEKSPLNSHSQNSLVSFLFQTLSTPPDHFNSAEFVYNIKFYFNPRSEDLYFTYPAITSPPPKV